MLLLNSRNSKQAKLKKKRTTKMTKYNAETTRKNLEACYGGRWFILNKSIVCPSQERTFSIDENGRLYPEDAYVLHVAQENKRRKYSKPQEIIKARILHIPQWKM